MADLVDELLAVDALRAADVLVVVRVVFVALDLLLPPMLSVLVDELVNAEA